MVSLYIFINFLYKLSLDFFEVEVDDDSFIFLSFLSFLLFVSFFLSSFLFFSLFIFFFSFFFFFFFFIIFNFFLFFFYFFSYSNVFLIYFFSLFFDLNLSLFCNNDSLSYCIEILSKLYILKSLENSLYNSSFLFSLKI